MRLKLTLSKHDGGASDIVVTTDATATVGEIAARVARDTSEQEGRTLAVTFPGETRTTTLAPYSPVAEVAIASGATVSLRSADSVASSGPVLALLKVVSGPDAGREFQLRAGSTVIGRDGSADFVLADPLVSKRHARVEVTRTVDLVDLNSANGIVIDGEQVTRVSLETGGTVQLGDDVLRVDIIGSIDDAEQHQRAGTVQFNRSPRVEPRYPGEEFEGPEVPKESEPTPFPWVALAAPAIMGVAFIFIPGVTAFRFLFIALAPIIMIGTFISQILQRRRKHQLEVKRFEKQLQYLGDRLAEEAEIEREVRLTEAPSTGEVIAAADALQPLLWTRRPEHWSFLNVRIGLGAVPSRNSVSGVNKRQGLPEYIERFEQLVESRRLVEGVPVVDNLRDAGALGIAGGVVEATEATHSLLAQLAGLYSPAELAFSAIVSPAYAAQFDWLKWLPHTASPYTPLTTVQLADTLPSGNAVLLALEELIEQRSRTIGGFLNQSHGPLKFDDAVMLRGSKVGEDDVAWEDDERPFIPSIVVLISDDAPVDRARLVALAERGALAGVYPIWLAESVAALPAACRTFVDLAGDTATVGYVRVGEKFAAQVDRITADVALGFARRLSGVADASAVIADQSDVPGSITLASLLGTDMLESADAIVDRWTQNDSLHDRSPDATPKPRRAGRLRAIVGQSSLDSMHLDLREQGPHALVGGTTGSGKSEFLQSWVLAMAAEYSPDRVTFLFVDYKGGSAFADCVNLPHTVGLVTDLSPHLVRRALTSLRAELQFREHLFNRKKAKDISELEKRGDPECPPSLVIVIDEFAALVGDVPEFVDGVVDIAQRGRSLGIHLIMATQRPAGVIRDNLRANTNLRIALRMADESDSIDVIGLPIAAGFDPATPGRAVAKTGPGRVVAFQAGYAGGWTSDEAAVPDIRVAELTFGFEAAWEEPVESLGLEAAEVGDNDTKRLVSTIVAASTGLRLPLPRKPWLDELAPVYDLARLHQRTDEELVIGVVDDPRRQAQYPVHFRPDTEGNLAVFGTSGAGKSVALRTLAVAAGITPRGGPVHVYGLDFSSGGLRMLESLPHVGSIVSGDDQERVVRLLRMLVQTIDARAVAYGANVDSIGAYRKMAGKPDEPRILLLVDGLAAFRQEYEFTQHPAFALFQQVLSEGRQVGVHVVVSVDRPGTLSPSIGAAIPRRLALRLAEDSDYAMVEVPTDILTAASPPGRAVIDGLELQVAVLGGSSNVAAQAKAIERLAAAMAGQGLTPPPAVGRLLDDVPFSSIRPKPGAVALGFADDDLGPVYIEPEGTFMLSGPPGSGRSSGMLMLTQSVRQALPEARMFYFGNAKSELSRRLLWEGAATTLDDAQALAVKVTELLQAPIDPAKRIVVVIESIADFLSTPVDGPLTALVKAAKRTDQFAIAESESSSWSQSWPLLVEFKNGRRGFALQPDNHEGDLLFKTTFPRSKRADFPAGRGWLVQGGRARKVQLAQPRRNAEG